MDRPSFASVAWASRRWGSVFETIETFAPSWASNRAHAYPMPLLPPVTSAFLPSSPSFIVPPEMVPGSCGAWLQSSLALLVPGTNLRNQSADMIRQQREREPDDERSGDDQPVVRRRIALGELADQLQQIVAAPACGRMRQVDLRYHARDDD